MDFFEGIGRFVLSVLGWLSLPLFGLSVWLLFRSVKRDMRLRVRTLVLPLATTVVVPLAYAAVLGVGPPGLLSAFLVVVGLAVGVVWSETTALSLRDGEVFGKRSPWYLVVWGGTFGLTQFLALVATPTLVAWGLSTLYLSMGVSIGTNGALLLRRARVGKGAPDHRLLPAGLAGRLVPAGASPVDRMSGVTCAGCGAPLSPDAEFCVACGRARA